MEAKSNSLLGLGAALLGEPGSSMLEAACEIRVLDASDAQTSERDWPETCLEASGVVIFVLA